ncbi:MAG: hypothetical protein FJ399_05340 [Verrucomicrobia bacterium]|nr:hypothetical protein [Verrucomicrobiota bacterium]
MADARPPESLEAQIEPWRSHVLGRAGGQAGEVATLEEQLRAEIAGLARAGLANDETFLRAAKRVGGRAAAAAEFAREQSERGWQQPGAAPAESAVRRARERQEGIVAFGLAVLAAMAVKVPALFGFDIDRDENVYIRNAGLFVLPCLIGFFAWKRQLAAGAVLIASWLVEAKKGVMENMAPMLTRLFTPLFATMLIAFLVAMLVSGRGIDIKREMLIGFDLLLVVVLGLLLYSMSARHPSAPPGVFDGLQVVLVVAALVADAVALWAIGARISEFGFSPNRVAALGENVILLVNLAGSAVLYGRFLLGRGSFASLERWQTGYLPVYALWGAIVVIVFPLLFRSA